MSSSYLGGGVERFRSSGIAHGSYAPREMCAMKTSSSRGKGAVLK
jgi:hypothetical protein